MEQCTSVEREVDKVLQKFLTYGQHFEQSLEELLHCVGRLRAELARAGGCPPREPHTTSLWASETPGLLGDSDFSCSIIPCGFITWRSTRRKLSLLPYSHIYLLSVLT